MMFLCNRRMWGWRNKTDDSAGTGKSGRFNIAVGPCAKRFRVEGL